MPAIWIPKRLVDIGLINTAAQHPASFINHCEIEYESRVLAAAAEARESGCKVIMLTGPSASGKTTTAHKLSAALSAAGAHSVVVSLDNFYLNIDDYPRLPDGTKDYENITALDIEEIHHCLLELIENGEAEFPEFDFTTEMRKPERLPVSLQGGVVIVEGIHALNPILTNVLPQGSVYKIYAGLREEYAYGGQRCLPTRDIRLARRMVRDDKFRGSALDRTIAMWPNVCIGEDTYIKAYKPYADLLLDTSFSYEICVLAPLVTALKGKLAGLPEGTVLDDLAERFAHCTPLQESMIPPQSMLREFIG
ncbi:nucleoside kinase [Ruminococcaceae bacterium OttesenSCG-928-A16]|nr:nucleoside kinase [Ruminococcaceae bacterium OttesenSCG-928-A16]